MLTNLLLLLLAFIFNVFNQLSGDEAFCKLFLNVSNIILYRVEATLYIFFDILHKISNTALFKITDFDRGSFQKVSSQIADHCVKSVRILEFLGPYFPVFGMNTDIYEVNLRIQSGCAKVWTRKTPSKDTFYTVQMYAGPCQSCAMELICKNS